MKLHRLSVTDFRNLASVEIEVAPRATVAVGPNAQGKTNLLEAIFYLATLKPLRATRLAELVRFGASRARVQGAFTLGGAERLIEVEIEGAERTARVDGKKAASLEDYFGGVSVVAFTPDDLEVIKGTPDRRRGLLDRAVFNRFPAFLRETRTYARALKNRNRLLKERAASAHLEAFAAPLCTAAARIWLRRRVVLAELAPRATSAFEAITRLAGATFRYTPMHLTQDFASMDEAALAEAVHALLSARLERDRERGFTSVGPHVDDVKIHLEEHAARAFASQGQQRALVLAWKIAEIENLSAVLGHRPLLLLDDVSSELDPERNAYLMHYLAETQAQVFLTTTDPTLVAPAAGEDTRWLQVSAGTLTPIATPPGR